MIIVRLADNAYYVEEEDGARHETPFKTLSEAKEFVKLLQREQGFYVVAESIIQILLRDAVNHHKIERVQAKRIIEEIAGQVD